jgi:hypothetical protein
MHLSLQVLGIRMSRVSQLLQELFRQSKLVSRVSRLIEPDDGWGDVFRKAKGTGLSDDEATDVADELRGQILPPQEDPRIRYYTRPAL